MIYLFVIIIIIGTGIMIFKKLNNKPVQVIKKENINYAEQNRTKLNNYLNDLFNQFRYINSIEQFEALIDERKLEYQNLPEYQEGIEQVTLRFKDYLKTKLN
jgi:predicted S18 family serine protease